MLEGSERWKIWNDSECSPEENWTLPLAVLWTFLAARLLTMLLRIIIKNDRGSLMTRICTVDHVHSVVEMIELDEG